MPPPEPAATGPRPNPFRDARPFGQIEIGGVLVPGVIQSVGDYTVKQDWNFQKASGGGSTATSANPDPANGPAATTATTTVQTAGSFGVSVWRGALLVEEVEITSVITTEQAYDDAIDFIAVLMPKRGRKVPSHSLVNPDANAVGVTRCAVRELAVPKEDKPGSGKYVFKFKICEYNPQKQAAAGKADPAKPGTEPKPADAGEAELQRLLNKAKE